MTGTDKKTAVTSDFVITRNGILKKCTGTNTCVVLPLEVKIISTGAFTGSPVIGALTGGAGYYLEELVCSESVKEINRGSFFNCTRLRKVTFCEGLTKIGDMAFYNCESIEEIDIPSSVKVIGKSAFGNCDSLKRIRIHDTLTKIARNSFSMMRDLSAELRIEIECNAGHEETQKEIVYSLTLPYVTYAYLHGSLSASEFVYDMIKKHLNSKQNRMMYMYKAIHNNDMAAIKSRFSMEITTSKKEAEEVMTGAINNNETEIAAWMLDYINSHF